MHSAGGEVERQCKHAKRSSPRAIALTGESYTHYVCHRVSSITNRPEDVESLIHAAVTYFSAGRSVSVDLSGLLGQHFRLYRCSYSPPDCHLFFEE